MDEAFQERYNLVLQAHDAAVRAIAPGKRGIEIDAVARNMIAGAGYGENFGHGLGHGVGLEGHEQPRLSTSGADALLMPGMVTTVEPGVYIEGWGGIRIENLIYITEDGAEVLSHCPEQPLLTLE
jgi:Xaa-Pro aminopeptidase